MSYIITLLLGSKYFWSWLIQLNRSYKYNENIARTGITTLNGHISKTVALREKIDEISTVLQGWFQPIITSPPDFCINAHESALYVGKWLCFKSV